MEKELIEMDRHRIRKRGRDGLGSRTGKGMDRDGCN